MPQNTIERELASVDLADGDATVDLPRSHYYQRLSLTLDWDITVDNTSAAINRSGILEAIQNIQVTFDGHITVKNLDLEMSHLIDQYQYGQRPLSDRLDFGTASQQTGTVQTFIDFLVHPADLTGMLPSYTASSFTLDLQAGDASDIEDGGDHITINALDVTVNSRERLRQAVAPNQQKEKKILESLYIFKERQQTPDLPSAGETEVDLPTGNMYYGIPLRVYDNGSPDNALVESFKVVEDGVDTHRSTGYSQARAKDQLEYGFQSSDLPDGFVYVNFAQGADLTDRVDTLGMDQWEFIPDTGTTSPTSPAEVEVVTQELIVNRDG